VGLRSGRERTLHTPAASHQIAALAGIFRVDESAIGCVGSRSSNSRAAVCRQRIPGGRSAPSTPPPNHTAVIHTHPDLPGDLLLVRIVG